jgi:hypothetical protein
MRLLLYPLHALVSQLSQLLHRFSVNRQSVGFSKTTTQASSLLRFEEVQSLLQRWWAFAERFPEANTRQYTMINTTLFPSPLSKPWKPLPEVSFRTLDRKTSRLLKTIGSAHRKTFTSTVLHPFDKCETIRRRVENRSFVDASWRRSLLTNVCSRRLAVSVSDVTRMVGPMGANRPKPLA